VQGEEKEPGVSPRANEQAVRTSDATIRLSPSYKLLYSLLGCWSLRGRHIRPPFCVNGRHGPLDAPAWSTTRANPNPCRRVWWLRARGSVVRSLSPDTDHIEGRTSYYTDGAGDAPCHQRFPARLSALRRRRSEGRPRRVSQCGRAGARTRGPHPRGSHASPVRVWAPLALGAAPCELCGQRMRGLSPCVG